jgi:hypothetical protein
MSAVAEKLREARALIERGWCQGHTRSNGSFCAWGALREAAFLSPVYWNATETFQRAVPPTQRIGIADWNDAPERTQAEVLAAFGKAIELAESDQ